MAARRRGLLEWSTHFMEYFGNVKPQVQRHNFLRVDAKEITVYGPDATVIQQQHKKEKKKRESNWYFELLVRTCSHFLANR